MPETKNEISEDKSSVSESKSVVGEVMVGSKEWLEDEQAGRDVYV